MRRARSGVGRRWPFAAIVICATLPGAGCSLVQPGCRNRDVKAAIEHEARASMELWMSTTKLGAPSAETPIRLADQVEAARDGNTRSCTANVMIGGGDNPVAVPIEYEVIVGDDGQAFYRWDKDEFGKQVIGTALTSIFMSVIRPKLEARPPDHPSPTEPPPAPPPSDMDVWKNDVNATILARARKLTGMPSGAQTILFRIGPDGDVTMAEPVDPIENVELAEKLVKFLDSTNLVAKPPSTNVTRVKVTFRF